MSYLRLLLVGTCTTLFLLGSLIPLPQDKIVFLDVGQGDAILLTSGTQQVLIDGGQGMAAVQRLGEEMPYFDRTVEVIISTHPDRDHLEGLLHVLERYEVELVLLPRVTHTSQLYHEWLTRLKRAAEHSHTTYRFAWAGQKLTLDDLTVELLGPTQIAAHTASRSGKTNNASVITRIENHGLSVLCTGDAEHPVERDVARRMSPSLLDVEVLKAGHHGSKTSTSEDLLAATTPSLVAISVGENRYGHPAPEVLERLRYVQVLRTDQSGSIRFTHADDEWFLSCGPRSLLLNRQKLCMKTDIDS